MARVLWLRSGDRGGDIDAFEQQTGVKVELSDGRPENWRGISQRIQLVLVELPVPTWTIQEALAEAHQQTSALPVLIYDREGTLDESVIKPPLTSFLHVTGDLTSAQLARLVTSTLEQAGQNSPDAAAAREPWRELLIGESRPMRSLHAMIRLVGPRQSTVLITGETGTGKEMVARAIHMASRRAGTRMVAVNCAAIPENLMEAELFGHAKGAFTGAVNDRVGRFEQAHRGTIFLDEIGEIPLEMQPKLLRVLQEREVQKVGASTTVQIDTRVIAASNENLEQAVAEKRFREDLLYRLNVVPIHVPPLRERVADIPLLAEHFLEKICRREDLRPKHLSSDALRRLVEYPWPGNVRQLEHAIEMAATMSGERQQLYLGDINLPDSKPLLEAAGLPAELPSTGVRFEEVIGRVERVLLEDALRKCGGNKAKAASLLGIPRTTLMYKVKALETCMG